MEKAASIILSSLGYDQILLPEIQQCLTQADVKCLIEGKPIQNSQLNSKLRYPKRLELQMDDLLTRPWLRDMYGIHDKETESRPNHSVLSLNTTVPEANNLKDELNVKKVNHVKKSNKDNSAEIRDLITSCMDDIAGDMSVTLCGHINYNKSENPEDWTLAGLNIETLVGYLEKAVEENVGELKTFAQLNLLVCGSEKFAEHLFLTLTKLDAAPKIMTAIRDEIPITPAPRGAQKFQYMFSGDYEDESAGRGENLLNSVLKLEMNESGEMKKSNMQKHVIDKMREIAIETLKHNSIIDNITQYMLPETPTMEKLNTVRHN
ncbi:hypothetical protein A8708_23690 [Paenibacillus oryzisoli]|uniref:Uncharacterized protein n=1 Tax=Paenibacillus oryzisoli TaxID=1850517 RepID=A0A198A0K1_9BACL|nr:hypothetical protein A8708_23690 [Paenibacillus oryzisoli]